MACHIIAASGGPGARRVKCDAAEEYLKSEENGIWMCYTHGKLIDTDEKRFTEGQLKTWRKLAELCARIHQETGQEPTMGFGALARVPLPMEELFFARLGHENEIIGNSILDCAVGCIWGFDFMHAVRDLLIELTKNAIGHGGAKTVRIKTEPSRIAISDDGIAFDPISLPKVRGARGGAQSFRDFLDVCSTNAIFAYRRIGGENEFTIGRANKVSDVKKITACSIMFKHGRHAVAEKDQNVLNTCSAIYLILPSFFSHSDAMNMDFCIDQEIHEGKEMVFVATDVSEGVLNALKRRYPNIRSIRLHQ